MRIEPNVVLRMNVVNQSSRGGQKPILIVVHDTESSNLPGAADLRAIGNWFDNPDAQASAHACVDGDGNSARYVPDDRKAWHCVNYNRVSLGLEQIGRAAQRDWPEEQLLEAARWIAMWHERHDIPIRKGAVSDRNVDRAGVVRHSDLGALGGGHSDPGANYPLADVLELARHISYR